MPQTIIIEKDCLDFPVAKRLRQMVQYNSSITYQEVDCGDDLLSGNKTPRKISRMKSTLLVTQRKGFRINKVGAGTANPACDYDIHFITGCPHRCMYCQQIYTTREIPYIAIYPDLQKIFEEVRTIVNHEKKIPVIFETGNMTDILAIDTVTHILREMILFWAQELYGRARLQFLTKSAHVQNLTALDHRGMVRTGFTLNLAEFIQKYECGTASLSQRLQAIRNVLQHGYQLHLSFSPIIYQEGIFSKYEAFFRNIKTFLMTCEGFQESELTLEVLILFQKMGGENLMRHNYPEVSEGLLQHLVYSNSRYCYPQEIYTTLISFLTSCVDTYFPTAKVLFIC